QPRLQHPVKITTILVSALSGALCALFAATAMSQANPGSSASISVSTGPHAGKYAFAPREACAIAAFGDQPLGLSVVLASDDSSLSLDMPNLDEKHAHEIQIVLV